MSALSVGGDRQRPTNRPPLAYESGQSGDLTRVSSERASPPETVNSFGGRHRLRGSLKQRPSIPRSLPPCAPRTPPGLRPSHGEELRSDRASVPARPRPHRTPRG